MDIRRLNLKDLWFLLVRRAWAVILAVAICLCAIIAGSRLAMPRYGSTATLYLLSQDAEGSESDFSVGLKIAQDCTYLLRSHAVLTGLQEELDLEVSLGDLAACISVANPENSRILEVTFLAGNPESAKTIVDALCRIGMEHISMATDLQIRLMEEGTLATEAEPIVSPTICLVGSLAAGLVVYGVILAQYLLDPKIRKEDDLTRTLGLTVLGTIPTPEKKKQKVTPIRAVKKQKSAASAISLALPGKNDPQVQSAYVKICSKLLFAADARQLAILSWGENSRADLHLAQNLALRGKSVLVIETLPVHGLGKPGLDEVLAEKAILADCVCPTQIDGVSLLPAGTHPADLFRRDSMHVLLCEAKALFDYVLIAAAPSDSNLDAVCAAACCDGVVLTVADGTEYTQIKEAISLISTPILGVIRQPQRKQDPADRISLPQLIPM